MSAASSTVRACPPTWATVPIGDIGQAGTRPKCAFRPTVPVKAAGMRIDPPPSVPVASGPSPAAMAATAPPEDPPGVFDRFQGLRVMPDSGLSVDPRQPNSGVAVLPSNTAPASRSRAVEGASTSQLCSGSTVFEPRSVGQPRVSSRSLIETGTPSSGPTGAPRCQRSSERRASRSADSWSSSTKALRCGLRRSMRSSVARVTSSGDSCLRR